MATVTTPSGEVLTDVSGVLLDYYRGEGYQIDDDSGPVPVPVVGHSAVVPTPDVPAQPVPVVPDAPSPTPEPAAPVDPTV